MKLTKDMSFADLLSQHPEAAEVLFEYGLHCIGCQLSPMETIEQGAKAHGLSDSDINKMIEKMNKKIKR